MNNSLFFDAVRKSLFKGTLTDDQRRGMTAILTVWLSRGTGDIRHLAYILATAYHETGTRMIPVREGQQQRKLWSDKQARNAVAILFKKGIIKRNYALPGSYGNSFYGRGYAQITWEANYKRMSPLVGVDLVRYPDKALEPEIAAIILIEGSTKGVSMKGDFTAFALEDFIHGDHCDYVGARKVINGQDKASTVAGYAVKFEAALIDADVTHTPAKPSKKAKTETKLTSDQLKSIQQTLKDKGYTMVGRIDGEWGDNTEDAILAFRRKNGLPLVPVIDDEFKAALWSGQDKTISEARSTAKLADLRGVAPGASEVDLLKKGATYVGLGSFATGGALSTDDITGVTSKISAVKELMAMLPSPGTLFLITGGALLLYFLVTRVGKKIVNAYREGHIA
ncbi:putative endolysin protein [Rhizobium phage RHph_I4]|nr:putative endolysin protein [Rhizobium phage RHph_I4]